MIAQQGEPTVPVQQAVPDAAPGNWVDRRAPSVLQPYLRLARVDRPIGSWLLLLPCWWSAALAAIAAPEPGPSLWHLALFGIGAVVMRGAGSTYNDIIDRDLDAKVARTRSRPLPSGQVGVRQACAFLAFEALAGLLVLLQFNLFTITLGVASLAIVAGYPFMKRVTFMPQLILGLAFAWGGLMGWAAHDGRLDAAAFLIYGGAIAWTIGYDTIYAMQDLEDDPIAGIKSSARLFGEHGATAVASFFALAIACLLVAVVIVKAGPLAYAGLALFAAHLAWQVTRIDRRDAQRALALFRSNRDAGLIFFAGVVLDAWLRHASG